MWAASEQPVRPRPTGTPARAATGAPWLPSGTRQTAAGRSRGRSVYSPWCASEARLVTFSENFEGASRTSGLSMSPRRSMSLIHCLGLRIASMRRRLLLPFLSRGLLALPVQRTPAHVDVVVVVAHGERVVGAVVGHQGDDLVRLHRALERQQALDGEVGDRARALVADDRHAVDGGDVDGGARGVLGHVARRGQVAVAAAQGGDRRLEAGGGEVLERGEHAAVDLAERMSASPQP